MARELRNAPAQPEFDAIAVPVVLPALPLPAFRLGTVVHPSQFFANPRSRLTPSSGKFPCCYMGKSILTSVLECHGDEFFAARKAGLFSITKVKADEKAFLEASYPPSLKLCNLTSVDVLTAIGLDVTTLHWNDITLAREWAERIANHPAQFDGVVYPSRHSLEHCVVLWDRPGGRTLSNEVKFSAIGPFRESPHAYAAAAKCKARLAFV